MQRNRLEAISQQCIIGFESDDGTAAHTGLLRRPPAVSLKNSIKILPQVTSQHSVIFIGLLSGRDGED